MHPTWSNKWCFLSVTLRPTVYGKQCKEFRHLMGHFWVWTQMHGNAHLLMSRGKNPIRVAHLLEPSEVVLFHSLMALKIIPSCCPLWIRDLMIRRKRIKSVKVRMDLIITCVKPVWPHQLFICARPPFLLYSPMPNSQILFYFMRYVGGRNEKSFAV